MWCNQCRQDVPGAGSVDGGDFHCPRCGHALCAVVSAAAAKEGVEPSGEGLAGDYDGWELDQQLQHVERILGHDKTHQCGCKDDCRQKATRIDSPHPGPSASHLPGTVKPTPARKTDEPRPRHALAALTWGAL